MGDTDRHTTAKTVEEGGRRAEPVHHALLDYAGIRRYHFMADAKSGRLRISWLDEQLRLETRQLTPERAQSSGDSTGTPGHRWARSSHAGLGEKNAYGVEYR